MASQITLPGKDFLGRAGCYSLIIDLKRKKTIRVGELGEAVFPVGTYVYTGSAMNGLGARLRRHYSRQKKIHWHIDYLLTLPEARIKKIVLYPAAPGQECRQNKRIAARAGAAVILKNFGASDCKSGCSSHLFFFAKDFLPKFLITHEGAIGLNYHSSEAQAPAFSLATQPSNGEFKEKAIDCSRYKPKGVRQ
jgi:Uri superfamily endonuclease